jgi:hypothetical protein
MNVTFKPELPQRIFWGVGAVLFSFPVIGILVEGPDDALSLGLLLICAAYVSWMLRSLLIRVVANESGVRVVGLFSDRTYAWDSIAMFEGPPQSRYVVLVTDSGDRHRLPGLHQSIVEQIQNRPSHTDDVSERLTRLLEVARGRRGAPAAEAD